MIFDIGRVCMKVAGRDAGKYCVVIKKEGDKVLVEGQTRRKSVNTKHLEPLKHVVKVSEGAKQADVAKALEKLGIVVRLPKRHSQKKEKGKA